MLIFLMNFLIEQQDISFVITKMLKHLKGKIVI